MLVGVLGGVLATLSGTAGVVFTTLEWFFGDPDFSSAVRHFSAISPGVAVAIVGSGIWVYHRAVLSFDGARRRTEVDRVYDHVLSGVALVTLAAGITILIVAVLTVFEPRPCRRIGRIR